MVILPLMSPQDDKASRPRRHRAMCETHHTDATGNPKMNTGMIMLQYIAYEASTIKKADASMAANKAWLFICQSDTVAGMLARGRCILVVAIRAIDSLLLRKAS